MENKGFVKIGSRYLTYANTITHKLKAKDIREYDAFGRRKDGTNAFDLSQRIEIIVLEKAPI